MTLSLGVVGQADRQGDSQFAAAGLVANAALGAGAKDVQLRLAERALETQQQSVVEVARIVEAFFIQDQRAGQGADLQQPVPIEAIAGQPGDLQAQHNAGVAQSDLGHQLLKTFPIDGGGGRVALVAVDDVDPVVRPAQRHRPLLEGILPLGALGVLVDLLESWTGGCRGRRSA